MNYWHINPGTCELHDHLGFTWEQYVRYVTEPSSLGDILEGIKNNLED